MKISDSAKILKAVCVACIGYALGDARNVVALFDKKGVYSGSEVFFFGLFCAALSMAIISGLYCLCAKNDVSKLLSSIREREPKQFKQ
jgi:hypothetical protein